MSVFSSVPISVAVSLVPSLKLTVISSAPSMTWLLVTMMPDGSMTKPEPSDWTRRGVSLAVALVVIEEVVEEVLEGRAVGQLGRLDAARAGHVWLVEMLTTASSSGAATSATDSGPWPARGLAGERWRRATIAAASPASGLDGHA